MSVVLVFFFFFFYYFNYFFGVLGLNCYTLVAAIGGYSLVIVVASRCRAWALGTQASVVAGCGLRSCGPQA